MSMYGLDTEKQTWLSARMREIGDFIKGMSKEERIRAAVWILHEAVQILDYYCVPRKKG